MSWAFNGRHDVVEVKQEARQSTPNIYRLKDPEPEYQSLFSKDHWLFWRTFSAASRCDVVDLRRVSAYCAEGYVRGLVVTYSDGSSDKAGSFAAPCDEELSWDVDPDDGVVAIAVTTDWRRIRQFAVRLALSPFMTEMPPSLGTLLQFMASGANLCFAGICCARQLVPRVEIHAEIDYSSDPPGERKPPYIHAPAAWP
jgi:hypothetical protein